MTKDYVVEVSKRIKDDWGNGREYYAMHGKPLLVVPGNEMDRPAKELLGWHNERVFVS